jgi:3',5'-cyclic AMP phosphodiesterase CpdA
MDKIIVFTDLHMVPEGHSIDGIDPYQRFLNGIHHVNKHHADAAGVILTGDLTDSADTASYLRLQGMLQHLKPPVHLMLGNHDDRTTFRSVFTSAPCDENGFLQQAIDLGATRLLLLDTVPDPDVGIAGWLCAARMIWLKTQLALARRRRVLVFMHHPPHKTGFVAMDDSRLANEEEFYALLSEHGNVEHIFAGHIHRTISGSCRGIPFSIFKSPVHQQPMTFNDPDSSLSVNEPAAYGIVLVSETSILVHTEDYELENKQAE